MVALVLRRLLAGAFTLAVVVVLSFVLVRLTPGSPFSAERAVAPEVRATLEARYGLDRPLLAQLGHYMWRLAHGDLGPSIKYPEHDVSDILAQSLPHTMLLAATSLIWGLLLGISMGTLAALYRGRRADMAVQAVTALLGSTPSFVLAPLLVLLLAVWLPLAPPAGWGQARHLVLPTLTLGSILATAVARLMRASLVELMDADFARTARAKGLSPARVVLRHLLRPALLPLVTYMGPAVGGLLVGSVAVERIFCVPGTGPYFVDAAQNRDYFLVMGIVVVEASLLLVCNIVADLLCTALDPRLRHGRS